MRVHIAQHGKTMGPFSLEEVNRKLAAGTLSPSDQAWHEGAAGWAPLSTIPGVNSGSIGIEPPSFPSEASPNMPPALARIEPLAIWSLVLSLLGLGCAPVAIGGVVCGYKALSKIHARPKLRGRGLAVAGVIIGYCVIYAVVAWVLIQVATQVFPFLEIPIWCIRLCIVLLALGFPIAATLAWAHTRALGRRRDLIHRAD